MGKVKESPSGQYVRYIGTADVREISKKDWDAVDLDHDTVVWSRSNDFTVPVEDISEDAWQYIDEDELFVVVKAEDPGALKLPSKHPALNFANMEENAQTAKERTKARKAAEKAGVQPGGGSTTDTTSATPAGGAVGGSTTDTTSATPAGGAVGGSTTDTT